MNSSFNEDALQIEPEMPTPGGDLRDGDIAWDDGREAFELFAFAESDAVDRSGLAALVNSSLIAHRRLPMLDVIFDRAARRMSTALRQLTDENVDVTLEDVTSSRFGDHLASRESGTVIAVLRARRFDAPALLITQAEFVHSVVDLLLGGRRSVFAQDENRRFTAIELGLAQRLMSVLTTEFDACFSAVAEAEFVVDRIETTPRFAAIAQDATACALGKFRVRFEDRAFQLTLLAPHASLEPVRDALMRDVFGESADGDKEWRFRLSDGVTCARVQIRAVLSEMTLTLGRLAALQRGQTLPLRWERDAPVELRAGDRVLARGQAGRVGERIAVRIQDPSLGESEPEAA